MDSFDGKSEKAIGGGSWLFGPKRPGTTIFDLRKGDLVSVTTVDSFIIRAPFLAEVIFPQVITPDGTAISVEIVDGNNRRKLTILAKHISALERIEFDY